MKRFVYTLMIIGCFKCGSSDTLEERMVKRIENCKKPCTITINDEVDFEWDKLYVFNFPLSMEEVSQVIGTRYTHYEEFSRSMIFFKGDSLVYHENNPANAERIGEGQIVFGGSLDTSRYRLFTPENARFKVVEKESYGKRYFELRQVK